VYENRIKSRGEAEKLSPEICKNKALGLFESVRDNGRGGIMMRAANMFVIFRIPT